MKEILINCKFKRKQIIPLIQIKDYIRKSLDNIQSSHVDFDIKDDTITYNITFKCQEPKRKKSKFRHSFPKLKLKKSITKHINYSYAKCDEDSN
jgi:hypothetical protein